MVAGRRFTDAATLEVMKYVVAGQLNVDLCARLLANGVMPVGLHGASGHVIQATRRPPQGHAGRRARPGGPRPRRRRRSGSTCRSSATCSSAATSRCSPASAATRTGQALNINGDTVASQLAGALGADALVLVTSTPGRAARRERSRDAGSRASPGAEFEAMVRDGTISGGMIPKLEESFDVLAGRGEVGRHRREARRGGPRPRGARARAARGRCSSGSSAFAAGAHEGTGSSPGEGLKDLARLAGRR